METRNEILLDENQHRLLMCCRMARALGVGEVYLDATTHKLYWVLEKDGRPVNRFRSMGEMEEHLEHLLENRSRTCCNGLGNMDRNVKRRMQVMKTRTNVTPMLFHSRINGM